MNQHHREPIASRRELGAVAAPLFGHDWSRSMAQALGWDPRACQRLGTPRNPLDERRARLMIECLENPHAHTAAAHGLRSWLIELVKVSTS